MIVVIAGVSGTGKTTIGQKLAENLGWVFADADDFHSAANKAKMHGGTALTDDDRAPWLASLHEVLVAWNAASASAVLACSALKASYRDVLGAGLPVSAIRYVYLHGSPELLASRLELRRGNFMNPALLASQLRTMEVPADALSLDVAATPEALVAAIEKDLAL